MINKAQQIRSYKQANPTHKPSDIAKACGATITYVYQVLHKLKPKKVKAVKPVATQPTAGQELLRKEIQRLNNELERWKNAADFQEARANECLKHNRELKLHHNGLEYVISYLESRLGITEKPNGASV
jgi:SRSO17 transposase